jgi:hypothetical protein
MEDVAVAPRNRIPGIFVELFSRFRVDPSVFLIMVDPLLLIDNTGLYGLSVQL